MSILIPFKLPFVFQKILNKKKAVDGKKTKDHVIVININKGGLT
jgi:hypothetical protein